MRNLPLSRPADANLAAGLLAVAAAAAAAALTRCDDRLDFISDMLDLSSDRFDLSSCVLIVCLLVTSLDDMEWCIICAIHQTNIISILFYSIQFNSIQFN